MPWLMASNPRRPFGILLRLRYPSRRFKEMLLALSYTAALLGHDAEVEFYAFDMLVSDGDDLRRLPLSMRKTNSLGC